jgi:hypothetical protein
MGGSIDPPSTCPKCRGSMEEGFAWQVEWVDILEHLAGCFMSDCSVRRPDQAQSDPNTV